ncbi:hypothetical protein BpHYR1_054140 [Brachionus plicatilis]|uniref:Uncharacterized protein n=1 Tax=Brachionus plicatilis TaxID=10195 RepID=A0A3M7S8R4_BRAPC|nr:hypothetical protein BpHYR1_054140 [Brachionus plicatilis]
MHSILVSKLFEFSLDSLSWVANWSHCFSDSLYCRPTMLTCLGEIDLELGDCVLQVGVFGVATFFLLGQVFVVELERVVRAQQLLELVLG